MSEATKCRWLRWLKVFLRIDPLVGMYFVTYTSKEGQAPNMGLVIGRIETGPIPKYLLRYFSEGGWPADENLIVDLWPQNVGTWCTFHETRTEAQKWWEWRSDNAARQRLAISGHHHPTPAAGLPN